ncbi:MAG: B-box zinc finger protein [Peptococcaceae bacterium]
MKCKYHEEREAAYICRSCNQPICEDCRLNINGENVCKNCIEAGYKKKKEGKLAIFFHFLCSLVPGAGQMQQGAMTRGVQIMLSFFTLGVIAVLLNAQEILFFTAVIWFYSFFDSYHVKKAKGMNVEDWDKEFFKPEYIQTLLENREKKWIAWILISLGMIALLNTFMDISKYFFNYHLIRLLQGSILPVIAIIAGWNILKKSKKIEDKGIEEEITGDERAEG